MSLESTLVVLKPDCVFGRLIGKAMDRLCPFADVVDTRFMRLSEWQVRMLYQKFTDPDTDFFPDLLESMVVGPSMVIKFRGEEGTVTKLREEALTFREMHKIDFRHNMIHSSETVKDAQRELAIFFVPLGKQ